MTHSEPLSPAGKAGRLWRTVRHLRPVQFTGRLRFRLARPRPDLSPAPPLREITGPWEHPAERLPSLVGPTRFRLLNEEGDLASRGWDDPQTAKLWRYNQHYFDDCNAKGAVRRAQWHADLIARWIADNPPGKGSGWEPYPTSLRIVNWSKWMLAGNAMGEALSEAMRHSLAVQSRWLMRRLEWHLLGNHLFVNAKALVFAGLTFAGEEADQWLETGLAILRREIPEQILADGGQFERSPMYHALALEDLLDLVNVARAFSRKDLAAEFARPVPTMLGWLAAMSHPDGAISFFNDAAKDVAPANAELERYAKALGFALPPSTAGLTHLAESGYVRAVSGAGEQQAVLIADLAPVGPDYLPGHAHADTLSFELSLAGRRVIVNSGTSVYGLGPERERQRGTAANSTLVIDRANSSEVWSGFRVGRRARVHDVDVREEGGALTASGAHDGYAHLPGSPVHRRQWHLAPGRLEITDHVSGTGEHWLDTWFHLAPGIAARPRADGAVELTDEAGQLVAVLAGEHSDLEVIPTSWHPQFGLCVKAFAVVNRFTGPIPHAASFTIHWNAECGS